MGDFDLLGLAGDLAALELQERRGVVDVGRVQQGTQSAGKGCGEAADELWQADSVGTAPWDELELDHPVHFGHGVVAFFPVTVQAHHFGRQVVDHHDVRGRLALGDGVVFQLQPCVDVVQAAQAVLVVILGLALDLVGGLLGRRHVGVHSRTGQDGVAVQARGHAALVIPVGDVIHLGEALGGVEVACGVGQQDVVDWQELGAGALLLLVVPELEVLRAAQWELGQHLLLLVAELFDLLGELPVHEVALALGDCGLLFVHVAQDLGLGRAVWREHLFDGAGGEVNAGLGHHGVNHLGCAVEVGSARCVVAHTGALNALFVLLIALLAGVLVLLDQLDVAQGQRVKVHVVDQVAVGQVLIEVLVVHWTLGVHGDAHATVGQLFQLGVVHVWHVDDLRLFAASLVCLVRVAADESVELRVYWKLGRHVLFLDQSWQLHDLVVAERPPSGFTLPPLA